MLDDWNQPVIQHFASLEGFNMAGFKNKRTDGEGVSWMQKNHTPWKLLFLLPRFSITQMHPLLHGLPSLYFFYFL
jgi:hypothetical protein